MPWRQTYQSEHHTPFPRKSMVASNSHDNKSSQSPSLVGWPYTERIWARNLTKNATSTGSIQTRINFGTPYRHTTVIISDKVNKKDHKIVYSSRQLRIRVDQSTTANALGPSHLRSRRLRNRVDMDTSTSALEPYTTH